MAMNCPTCGAKMLDGASFCERCGLQVGIPPFKTAQLRPQPAKDNKVLWIIAIVVIVVVVVPLVLSAVMYFMVLGFDGTNTHTPTSVLMRSTVTGGYKFTFGPVTKDTQWSDATILLSDESQTAVWYPTTTDLDGGITAEWVGGSQMLGTLNVFDNVTDLEGNGYVNQGDYFTLTLGTGQVFSSSTFYTVIILHEPSSAEMCQIGFHGDAETAPVSSLTKSTVTDGFMFTFASMTRDTPWGDVTMLLSDGLNTAVWSPLTTDLDNGTVAIWNRIVATANLGTLKVNMSVIDLAGNGYVNQGDYFVMTLGPGQTFSSATTYTVTVMYDPLGVEICHLNFQGEVETTPTSSLTKSSITDGVKLTFAPMTIDTQWGDVTILLTDGSNTATWSPLTTDLVNGTTARWNVVAATPNLGTLKVNMSIIDLAGNGYINQGDYFTLTLGSGQAFSTATTYTATIMYIPTASEICHLSFTG